jgi:hypothetical protein
MYINLPPGAVGAGAMQGSSTLATVQGDRVRINGPFPPGITQVQIGYRYPYRGDTVVLTQQWPAAFEEVFVAAEKVGNMQMTSPQFQQTQDANAGGTPFIMAQGGRLNAGDTLSLTLTGLPHRNMIVRDVGLAAGALILLAGLWFGISGRRASRDHVKDLTRRKEKLLADLVALEQQRRAHRIEERKYVSRRQALVTQLERVMGELDEGGGSGVAA